MEPEENMNLYHNGFN